MTLCIQKNPELQFTSELIILLQQVALSFKADDCHSHVNHVRRFKLVQPQELSHCFYSLCTIVQILLCDKDYSRHSLHTIQLWVCMITRHDAAHTFVSYKRMSQGVRRKWLSLETRPRLARSKISNYNTRFYGYCSYCLFVPPPAPCFPFTFRGAVACIGMSHYSNYH